MLPPVPHQYLVGNSSIPPLITQLLFNRGLKETAQVTSFLNADESLSNDPLLLTDMHQAVARIYQALLSGEPIAIYGDYDADGITATALLVQGLSTLGGTVIPYIPHRLTEGYGLKTTALENLRQQGIGLVVTVDCGITSLSEVKKARRAGLDIVITDHHTPLPETPPAAAIINPKLAGSTYPFTELTGVGVAFKLLQALYQSVGREGQLEELVDLAALGTVADMSPLLGENRYLVKEGLTLMNRSPRLGIRALIEQAGLSGGSLDAECISWVIAPRLNAAGRLEHAMASYKLLMTNSPAEASRLARWLEQKNAERQRLTANTVARARQQVLSQGISPLLVASDGDYFLGIAGLVASRLVEEYYRPTVVVRTGEKVSSGSCRSIPEFNIIAALTESRHLLSQFGGHSQAAGFTLPTRNLPRLEETLLKFATDQLRGADLRPALDIDAEVTLPDLGGDTFQMTQQLAPFGRGNPVPTYLSRRVEVMDCRTMGNGGEHLRFRLTQGGTKWDGVAFRLGNYLADVAPALDIVYNLEIDRWRGKETLRLNIMDFAPAG
ncbi:MAG: single-stranded-DNA-specific exonuclease RecJ [Dehalococcoidia bacterium SG8_51_3]|nr:MAG: single-stranded-DNA-specific exonuclease RecJ [Dehalococcoidia bacterium SG8_51_3]